MSSPQLLLLSQGFTTEKIQQHFLATLPDVPGKLNAAIVTTASPEWKQRAKGAVAAYEYLSQAGFARIDFVDIEFEAPQKLDQYPFIYLSGGNPSYFLLHLKRSRADETIRALFEKGTYLAGGSAGAVVFGPDIRIVTFFEPDYDSFGLKDLSALNCVPFTILPHANRYRQKIADFDGYLKGVRHAIGYDILGVDDDDDGIFVTDKGITRI